MIQSRMLPTTTKAAADSVAVEQRQDRALVQAQARAEQRQREADHAAFLKHQIQRKQQQSKMQAAQALQVGTLSASAAASVQPGG